MLSILTSINLFYFKFHISQLMGNFSVHDRYVPAQAKALRDRARTLSHSDPTRKHLLQEAAQAVFEYNNDARKRSRHEVDLNGLYMEEALEYAEREIQLAQEQLESYIVLIVGRGLHSRNDIGVLREMIEGLLTQYNLSYEIGVPNDDSITVRFETSEFVMEILTPRRSWRSTCTILWVVNNDSIIPRPALLLNVTNRQISSVITHSPLHWKIKWKIWYAFVRPE